MTCADGPSHLHFEHHVHAGGHLDALGVGQAQHAVVVEDSVHRLDPQCVDGPVEIKPVTLALFGCQLHNPAPKHGHDAICPLVCEQVELAKELALGD